MMELIVVIAVIVILAAVAVPSYISVLNKAKYEADITSVVILNQATVAYAMANEIQIPDIFGGISEDAGRIQKLVDENFLSGLASPQQNGAEFNWIIDGQLWVINGGMNDGADEGQTTQPPGGGGDDLSGYPVWDPAATYELANTYVVYEGKLYYNLWWVNGSILPGTAQVWQEVSDEWVFFNIYNSGDTVEYGGGTYKARYWTSGQTPVDSESGPWELIS